MRIIPVVITLAFLLMLREAWAQPTYLDRARADVEYLCSPELLGRGYYGDGAHRAASFIRDRFRMLGLDSLDGDYFQTFSFETQVMAPTPWLTINDKPLRFGIDYLPVLNGGSGTTSDNEVVVRVGHGLIIPRTSINQYRGQKVDGGVVIIKDGASDQIEADTTIDRALLTREAKVYFAKRMGARAVIFPVERLSFGVIGSQWELPVFEVLESVLPSDIEMISLGVRINERTVQASNVIALLRGTTHPDSTIILCAHYDHLGAINDTLYFPGANDNASGVAMLLELARKLKEHPLKYSVLFVAFSGEEAGLQGSRYYVQHPRIDLAYTRFLINLDMTASGNEGMMAVGGVDFPEEFAQLAQVADSLKLGELRKRANAPNSDQYFFLQQGVRGFYIYPYTGLQPYHHINDQPATLEWYVFNKLFRLVDAFLNVAF